MRILWLTWKDKKHPLAGGAETVNEELAKRLVQDGHKVILLTAGFKGGAKEEIIDGYKIIRLGNRWTVYWLAFRYYKKNLQGWADLVIDEMNTIPFFAKFYVKSPLLRKEGLGVVKTDNILFVHQLCRKIWFYQMFFPLNLIGYLLEPIYLRLLNDRQVITVSESTKKDLMKYGFKKENIKIISEGIELTPVICHPREGEDALPLKYKVPTILSFGSVRPMKRTDQIIKAFEIAKDKISTSRPDTVSPQNTASSRPAGVSPQNAASSRPAGVSPQRTPANNDLNLIIAGDYNDKFGRKIYQMAKNSKYSDSIKFLGRVSGEEKIILMQKSHLLCVTSVKEGWGLTVTEANSQGTPAVVYDVDGLRDSVQHNETGLICPKNTPESLAENIEELLKDKGKYDKMRFKAWQWSKEINFEKSYRDFVSLVIPK